MIKFAKIIDEETKECQVGTGTNTKFYESIGMVEMDVEQGYDGNWYLAGYAPVEPLPTNDDIKKLRANLYAELIDPLHAQKQRKTVLGTWTEADEAEYVEQVKTLTVKIQKENPYVSEV